VPVLFGLDISQHQLSWEELVDRARFAEEAGFDGAWLFDHFKPLYGRSRGPCLESWTALAALAAETTRIRLGVLVTGITYRHPSILATQVVTADHVSHGRVELGVGAAWHGREHRELGIDFPPAGERIRRLEEAIEVIDLLTTSDDVSFKGRYYRLENASYNPKPVQRPRPPLWIGGGGEKQMLSLVARKADVWHGFGNAGVVRRKSQIIDERARRAGRDPAQIRRSTSLSISEPWDHVRGITQALAEVGIGYLTVSWPTEGKDRLVDFVEQVMPKLAAL
jgi:F420-dependent oxidoreductase-like protein